MRSTLGESSLPSTPEQKELSDTPSQKSTPSPSETKKLARELHWLEKLNLSGQIALVAVGIAALCVYLTGN